MRITDQFKFLAEKLSLSGTDRITATGTERNARLLSAVCTFEQTGKTVFLVCRNDLEARSAAKDLEKLLPSGDVLVYPSESFYFSLPDSYSMQTGVERIKVICRLREGVPAVVVTGAFSLCETYPALPESFVTYKQGDEPGLEKIVRFLSENGYSREDKVFSRGQFSVRGGIIDFFSAVDELPVRVEFWGDEIDSIRSFSPETRLSVRNEDSFTLTPFSQYRLDADEFEKALSSFVSLRDSALTKMEGDALISARDESASLIERMRSDPSSASKVLFPLSDAALSSVLSETDSAVVMLADRRVLESGVRDSLRKLGDDLDLLGEKALAFYPQKRQFRDISDVTEEACARFPSVVFSSGTGGSFPGDSREVYIGGADVIDYKGSLRLFLPALDHYRRESYKVVVCLRDESDRESFSRLMESYSVPTVSSPRAGEVCGIVTGGSLGVDFPQEKLLFIPYEYLMPRTRETRKKKHDVVGEFFSDIKPGDYVVHDTQGIGIYDGITRIDVDGVSLDYIKISYAKGDVLFVPPEQMDLIQKYVGAGDAPPKITRLGSQEWSGTKKKVSKAVKELAEEYLRMYAVRQNIQGYAFGQDTVYQAEFEDAFEYVPTDDQIRASEEIKRDMERSVPMDRLLMGDVGFGKTEVAMRAAFKAVMEPKQVAVLVPTTILALQHYNNFRERFRGYPVNIELMCRFRTASQIKKTAKDLKDGKVDILIGTHRILSKDVEFRDLGLLIIDEEQRFGVAHKDRLKLLKENVDTLTLSATPIPRTMHMSLSGIRDMSVLDTPPGDKMEVQTYVMPSDETVIKSAVMNEVNRGGQVFYLYNRVDTIAERAMRLRDILPGVRVDYAHGQMNEKELEGKILDFLDGKFDVLVCTTIIENGVDMVNTNTIIIEDADRLGLSQLYQLRGRVGRGSIRAYAYMLYNPAKMMNETASKRLQTIKEFTRFGSGFRIAMRDLQIRGSGNILGAAQSGHFANVGYEMYMRLLSEAVSESSGQAPKRADRICEMDLRTDAFIPKEYIESEEDRIIAYKNIALIKDRSDMERVMDELTDIYSDVPEVTLSLLRVALLKSLCVRAGIVKAVRNGRSVMFTFDEGVSYDPAFLSGLSPRFDIRMRQNADSVRMVYTAPEGADILSGCCDLMELFVCNEAQL